MGWTLLLVGLLAAPSSEGSSLQACHLTDRLPRFAELQLASGAWDADGPNHSVEGWVPGAPGDDLLVTSLVVLDWLATDEARRTAAGQDAQRRALAWIAKVAGADGPHHALAVLALSEAIRSAADWAAFEQAVGTGSVEPQASSPHVEMARRGALALEAAVRAGGGWSATGKPTEPLDPMATLWSALALRSALDTGLIEAAPELERAAVWFRAHSDPMTALVGGEGLDPAKATLVGLVVRGLAGEELELAQHTGSARTLRASIETCPAWGDDPELVFLTTLACTRLGGEAQQAWDALVIGKLRPFMNKPFASVESHAPVDGTLASSAYFDLTLSLYFRYPLLAGRR